MATYMYIYVTVSLSVEVYSETTVSVRTSSNNLQQQNDNNGESSSSGGLGTTGLIVLLVAVALLFLISVIIALVLIQRRKKRMLEIRANRSSYVNRGYEQTETEQFTMNSERNSQKSTSDHVPPIKPTRKSSSKKSQKVAYENIEIGLKNAENEKPQSGMHSLPRNVHESVTLVVPNLTIKSPSTGSSIPYIDASKENLDKVGEKTTTSSNNNAE